MTVIGISMACEHTSIIFTVYAGCSASHRLNFLYPIILPPDEWLSDATDTETILFHLPVRCFYTFVFSSVTINNFLSSLIYYSCVFLTCVSHTAHVIDIGCPSVRLSVCLSVRHTLVLCQNGSTYRQTVFTAL